MILNIFNFARNKKLFMIQRIQTLYLLIADFLVAILFLVPYAEWANKEGVIFQVNLLGFSNEGGAAASRGVSWPVLMVSILLLVMLIIAIFQYKNRARQIKLAYVAIALHIVLVALFQFHVGTAVAEGEIYAVKMFASFPLVAAVFTYLAIRGISKDENLVKSIDRIR